ncbi:CRISPR-associated endonuclease Cas6 [Porphyromonas sp.]
MVEMSDVPVIYQLSDWLPLNDKNYKLFERERGLAARILKLQQILTGNVLSMLKGVGIFVPSLLETEITAMTPMRSVKYKGVPLVTLDVQFAANVSLPDQIGLGRHASVGFGTLTRIRN